MEQGIRSHCSRETDHWSGHLHPSVEEDQGGPPAEH